MTSNSALERTAGSHALAAAAHRNVDMTSTVKSHDDGRVAARGVEPREIAELRNQNHRSRQFDAAQRLDRLHHRIQPPALHRLVQLVLQALPPLLLLGHRAHIFLEDDLLHGRRTHDLRQPAEMGGVQLARPS